MASGLSQTELGKLLGAKQSVVQPWVSEGGEGLPDVEGLALLTKALKVSGHWLLTGQLPMEAPGLIPELDEAFALGWRMGVRRALRAVEAVADPIDVSPAKSPTDLSEFEILRTDALTRQTIEDAERTAARATKPRQGGA